MEHRGEILKQIMAKLKVSQRTMASFLGVHHNTVANYLDRADLSDDIIFRAGEKLRYDIKQDFPSLKKGAATQEEAQEASITSQAVSPLYNVSGSVPDTLPACQRALMKLQADYITLQNELITYLRISAKNTNPQASAA